VAWEHGEGRFFLELEVPPGCRARVSIPPPARGRCAKVEVNGTTVWAGGSARSNRLGISAVRLGRTGRSLRLEAPAGRYRFEARQ